MNVELRHLRVVVLVAEAGSVGRAARWLKVSQPSLTAQLKRIEAAFGGDLFSRSRTGVTPTPLGRYAVDRARAMLVDVDHLSATVSALTWSAPRRSWWASTPCPRGWRLLRRSSRPPYGPVESRASLGPGSHPGCART